MKSDSSITSLRFRKTGFSCGFACAIKKTPAFEPYVPQHPDKTMVRESFDPFPKREETASPADIPKKQPVGEQMTLAAASPEFLTDDARKKHRIIGQLFQTYWLIEYEDKLYIMDQHAAHEKVLLNG